MPSRFPRRWVPFVVLASLVLALPISLTLYQSRRSGLSVLQLVARVFGQESPASPGALREGSPASFLTPTPLGSLGPEFPMISHVEAVDLDRNGRLDIVVADAKSNRVSWFEQLASGEFTEHSCAEGLIAPAHVHAVDFDNDGDLDIIVAVLGMLFPNNDPIGSVVLLENAGMTFSKRVLLEKVARVSDVRSGDLDGDGDLDLAVAQFGYDDGETRWLENLGNYRFESHVLQSLSGPIHAEIVDIDRDGDLDIVSLVSQEWEEIYLFENQARGVFRPRLLWGSSNDDFGSSGLSTTDLDKDGDVDVLFTNGDAFDYMPPRPRAWHGVQWLRNDNGTFVYQRIADLGGAYSARSSDVDRDGDLDVVVVSAFNLWEDSNVPSLVLLENDGTMTFSRRVAATRPTHLLTLAVGDFDSDGSDDFVTGSMHAYPPYDRLGRVILWKNLTTHGGGL